MRWKKQTWKPKLTRKELERRRLAAAEDLLAGMNQWDVSCKYNVNPSSVCRWNQMLKEKGMDGLHQRKAPGQSSKLSKEQQSALRKILFKGAVAYGYKTDLWTLKRIAEVIQEEFDVTYHFLSLSDVLHRMNFSPQKPKKKAAERDETMVRTWLANEWRKDQKNL